jgi:hypothetical protein
LFFGGLPSGGGVRNPAARQQQSGETLLTRLIFSEATNISNDPENQVKEMAAIGYSALERLEYLTSHRRIRPGFFGARDKTLLGVISAPGQYGSYNQTLWNKAGSNLRKMNHIDRDFLNLSNAVAYDILKGLIPDPFGAQGGTFGLRTHSHTELAGPFFLLPQIPGSLNDFFGMTQ